MVAAGKDHLLATGHDGGKRVQARAKMRRAAFPAQEHHRGPDPGIDVQAQSQSLKIGDLAWGQGAHLGDDRRQRADQPGPGRRHAHDVTHKDLHRPAGLTCRNRRLRLLDWPAPRRRAGRGRRLEEHRAGERGGRGRKSLQRHHRPRGMPGDHDRLTEQPDQGQDVFDLPGHRVTRRCREVHAVVTARDAHHAEAPSEPPGHLLP